jgi:hypothetical protein
VIRLRGGAVVADESTAKPSGNQPATETRP